MVLLSKKRQEMNQIYNLADLGVDELDTGTRKMW